MSRSVKGKSAIVTGAGSGINLEFARLLLQNGCNVVIGDLSLRPEAQELIEKYSKDGSGAKAVFQKTDVTSWSDLHNLFQAAEQNFGNFDIICPGAGVFEPESSGFWNPPGGSKSKDDPFGNGYKSIDINLIHPVRATQMAISHYLASDPPPGKDNLKVVVHLCSIAGEMGFTAIPLYNVTKWGIRGFVYALAEIEETRGIRVAGLCPAIVRTPIWLEAEDKRRVVSTADGKVQDEWTTPEEVAEVMLKVCTENEIANSKGEMIPIRGGTLIEVIHDDVRDVPCFGNQPPGTGTEGKGLAMVGVAEAWKTMNASVEIPNWGKI